MDTTTADLSVHHARTTASRHGNGIALGAIWVATAAVALFAPDMVTGSAQEHLPLAAITVWLWSAAATAYVVLAAALTRATPLHDAGWYPLGVTAVWTAVALAAVFGPELVTGSDPTRIPVLALVAPIVGAITTGFLAMLAVGRR